MNNPVSMEDVYKRQALALGIVICILIEDTILQITEELSVTFLLWMFICMLLRKEKQNDERI